MPNYIPAPGQEHALNAAIRLRQPLLLTGEPGTGKTEMARWALEYLSAQNQAAYWSQVLRFNTKTTSKASDLFYTYDALSHFQAANLRGEKAVRTEEFIELQPFGKAIAYSDPWPEFTEKFRLQLPEKPMSAVVLIDEVDKAPRDFTNDLLDEMENFRFAIKELPGFQAQKGELADIVVVLTSNSEKNLPDAFLRRCAFFHLEFPRGERLRQIVEAHLSDAAPAGVRYDELITLFETARDKAVRKKPATAELIAWLNILGLGGYWQENDEARRKEMLRLNLPFLVKTKDDLDAVRGLL